MDRLARREAKRKRKAWPRGCGRNPLKISLVNRRLSAPKIAAAAIEGPFDFDDLLRTAGNRKNHVGLSNCQVYEGPF